MLRVNIFLFALVLGLFVSCSSGTRVTTDLADNNGPHPADKTTTSVNGQVDDTSQCDRSLWERVYDPSRLEVIDPCKVVTGVIEELDQNEDGDTHMLLKLDPGGPDLLAKKNYKKKNGDLVIEVICANAITDKKAVAACKGYSNLIMIPTVGDHVRVTGSYVNDTHNGWTEIHPVSRIEKM